MRLYRTPYIADLLYPRRLWRMPQGGKVLYLTFDDGPTPELCPWILEQLDHYQAKGTFFCVGSNVEKNPQQWFDIQKAGHQVGNHTNRHLNGWKSSVNDYLDDIAACARVMSTKLFRPPYGRITSGQAEALLLQGYRIVMWSILTHDFDPRIDKQRTWDYIAKNTQPGDIFVFHDNLKARENLEYLLPRTLAHFSEQGYTFATI